MKVSITFGNYAIGIVGEPERVVKEIDRFYAMVALSLVEERATREAMAKQAKETGH